MPNVDIALDLLIFCTKWFLNDRSADACPIKKGYIRPHLEFLNSINAAAVGPQSDTDHHLLATHHNKVQGSGLLLYNAIVPCRGNFFNVLNARIVNPVGVKMWHDLQPNAAAARSAATADDDSRRFASKRTLVIPPMLHCIVVQQLIATGIHLVYHEDLKVSLDSLYVFRGRLVGVGWAPKNPR